MTTITQAKRLTVMQALTARLKTITKQAGYLTDIGNSVKRGILKYGADDPVPMLSIVEYPEADFTAKPVSGGKANKYWLDLMVQGWTDVPEDGTDPTDATTNLLADVKKCLSQIADDGGAASPGANYMLGGLISGFEMAPGLVRPADENSSVPCFYLRVRVEVAENPSDPYDVL